MRTAGLALALGRPRLWFQAAGRRTVVFVLDNSASMRALEGRAERFDLARGALRRQLGDLADLDDVALVTTCPPETVLPPGRSRAALLAALDVPHRPTLLVVGHAVPLLQALVAGLGVLIAVVRFGFWQPAGPVFPAQPGRWLRQTLLVAAGSSLVLLLR